MNFDLVLKQYHSTRGGVVHSHSMFLWWTGVVQWGRAFMDKCWHGKSVLKWFMRHCKEESVECVLLSPRVISPTLRGLAAPTCWIPPMAGAGISARFVLTSQLLRCVCVCARTRPFLLQECSWVCVYVFMPLCCLWHEGANSLRLQSQSDSLVLSSVVHVLAFSPFWAVVWLAA